MVKTKVLSGLLLLALALSLAGFSCSGPTTGGTSGADCSAVESQLASEKQKSAGLDKQVKDLQAQLAASQKPAKTSEILLECGVLGGMPQRAAEYFQEELAKVSDGRLQVEVVLGEAVTPTAEQLEATGQGIFDMLITWHPYFRQKVPLLDITVADSVCLRSREDLWAMYEFQGWGELMKQEFAKLNVLWIGSFAQSPGSFLLSKVPVPDYDSLKGMKIRGTGLNGMMLTEAGASVVVIPGGELYTSLSSGLVDACHYSTPGAVYDMGLQEVTSYWIMPAISRVNEHGLDANMDFWNELSPTDQALVYDTGRYCLQKGSFDDWEASNEALAKVQEQGIEVQYWDAASVDKWVAAGMKVMPEPKDEAATLAREQLLDYMRSQGYIE